MEEQPDKRLSLRWDGAQWVSGDGQWAWDGSQWLPIRSKVPASVVYFVTGGLTLLLALFAIALGGDSGPSMTDLAILATLVGISVALVATGLGVVFSKSWSYWSATIGVLLPSAILPWFALQDSQRLPPQSSVPIGPGSAAPGDAATYYSIFLVSIAVALIAVWFRRSWFRWLAIPAVIFMAISCFELPAAVALIAALATSSTWNYWRRYGFSVFKGVIKAASNPPGGPYL